MNRFHWCLVWTGLSLLALSPSEAAPRKSKGTLLAAASIKPGQTNRRTGHGTQRGWLAESRHKVVLRKNRRVRSTRCWRVYKDTRRDVRRHRKLWPRLRRFRCHQKSFLRCRRKRFRGRRCAAKRWGACYHIYRRLSVIVARLKEENRLRRRYRCRWKLQLPREHFKRRKFTMRLRYSRH